MSRRSMKEIKKRDYLKLRELAEYNGVRYFTVEYYANIGLLPFEQRGKRGDRFFPAEEASRRLREIVRLRKRGYSIPDLLARYNAPIT